MKHRDGEDSICCRYPWNDPQRLEKETGETWDQRKNRGRPDRSTVEIGKNFGKSPGDPSILSHFNKKNHHLEIVWKIHKFSKIVKPTIPKEKKKVCIKWGRESLKVFVYTQLELPVLKMDNSLKSD